ncbi:phosphotransferase enzyme family protein [Propioniciclava soli]|uniref:Phosphotransferase n=1 Tax=Propioniciclava soli TaxID=2775081 RepID=A0ABZ3C7Q6_9ACTN|nr:phosphotransferase [Propioniciclava soli]
MAKPEKPLEGGNMTPVSRRGDQVLREAGPWTPTVQRLLAHIREQGVEWAPEPLGWTKDGREALAYLKGKVPTYPMPDWVYSEETLVRAGQWLRELHDATADYTDPEARWRVAGRKPAEVICHNDFAPYNMVFKNSELVGVIDWDFAAPGPRLWDLAYLAYRLVPLMREENPAAPAFKIDLAARLQTLMDAYGSDASVPELLGTMVARLEDLAALTHSIGLARKDDALVDDADNYTADAAFLSTLLR